MKGMRVKKDDPVNGVKDKLESTLVLSGESEVSDDSTLGDDSSHGGGPTQRVINPLELAFLNDNSHLLESDSSSSESSYWSDSDESSDEDSEEDSDESLQHGEATTSEDEEPVQKRNVVRRKKDARRESNMSIDAFLKLKMQMGDNAKAAVGGAAATKNEREARRRNRRLPKSASNVSLGALAKQLGTSTGNDIVNEEVQEVIGKMKRSESLTGNILKASRPKRFLHIQQEGSVQGQQAPPMRSSQTEEGMRRAVSMGGAQSTPAAKSPLRRGTIAKYGDLATSGVKPKDHYMGILRKMNVHLPFVPYDELPGFFLPVTEEDKAAFDMELVRTVRDQDLAKLKRLQARGHPLQARSHTGESLLHVCARRGTPEMLRYMLSQKDDVSLRVCCDYGRTCLHDAAWSNDPKSLEMMKILIQQCPDLLLVLDKRGFMPLDYIPKDRWPHCCAFLDKHMDILKPTGILFDDSDDSDSYSGSEESEEESSSG